MDRIALIRAGVIGALGNPAFFAHRGRRPAAAFEYGQKETRAFWPASLLLEFTRSYFLHPEQEAQQSAEGQHAALAAFAAPAKPSRVTANSRTTFILFMNLLLVR